MLIDGYEKKKRKHSVCINAINCIRSKYIIGTGYNMHNRTDVNTNHT